MTNEWQYNLEPWEYVKAHSEGWEVEYKKNRVGVWFILDTKFYNFSDCEFRTRKPAPEKSEAEKFLEKWKGQRIRLDHWPEDQWFVFSEIKGRTFYGFYHGNAERLSCLMPCNDVDLKSDWQPYTEPEELEALPDELSIFEGDFDYDEHVKAINFLLREAKRNRGTGE